LDAWFVMLTVKTTRPYRAFIERLLATCGATPVAEPHLTVAYLTGPADTTAVADRLRAITGPAIRVHAHGLFSFGEEPHSLFGYQLCLHVRKSRRIAAWHRAALEAIAPLGLCTLHPWFDFHPHVRVVSHMEIPPRQAMDRLGDVDPAFTLIPEELVVTHYRDGEFTELLRRPI